MEQHVGGTLGGLDALIMLAVGLVLFVFWLWMLVDAIKNPRLSGTEKVVWVLVILFLNGLGALIYFFIGRGGSSSA